MNLARLAIGFLAGWWSAAAYGVCKRKPARATGKLTVQYRGPLDFSGTELEGYPVVIRGPEGAA